MFTMKGQHDMASSTASEIPSQHGRSIVITGTGGLGARAGGEVILAGRNADKGAAAVAKIRADTPTATIRFEILDLANLASIKAFGMRMQAARQSLDLLINNAAVMAPPDRQVTSDGFELQFGTNYLGHFTLAAASRCGLIGGGHGLFTLPADEPFFFIFRSV
jgi:NAD(P)-dependent dehydrogenase (short-subunit alcohol dehydrogenase family)